VRKKEQRVERVRQEEEEFLDIYKSGHYHEIYTSLHTLVA
jgi:hypothetical protein